jgi:drug/metabolite transporter (DMT)-like permease
VRTAILSALALCSFAANSILCRLALAGGAIDPALFTAVRLFSGAVVLAALLASSGKRPLREGNWISAAMLFAYAIAFSLAYVGLKAGTGALLLFGSVQATMILYSMAKGHHPHWNQWVGLLLAVGGLVYLVMPGLAAPPYDRALLMIAAGVAWGIYSLRGRKATDPVAATGANFIFAAPLALVPLALDWSHLHWTQAGLLWAVLSGAVTSGLGYVIWYAVLPSLGSVRAAIVQLLVPVLAALAAATLLNEPLTTRLVVSGLVTLGGVALAVFVKAPKGP